MGLLGRDLVVLFGMGLFDLSRLLEKRAVRASGLGLDRVGLAVVGIGLRFAN